MEQPPPILRGEAVTNLFGAKEKCFQPFSQQGRENFQISNLSKRQCQSPQTALSDIVYVGRDLPLIFHLLMIQTYCANPLEMNQLFTRGISSVAQVVA